MPKYYTKRKGLSADDTFEESYWGEIVDPDGKRRNRLEEREQALEDLKEELATINAQPAGKILDIGCGPGFLLSGVDDAWEKHGVEVSAFAAKHAEQYGNIFNGTLDQAAYPDDHFDLVVLHHVIEHIPEPEDLIGEIWRIMKEGATLILGTPDFDGGCARRFSENFRLLHDQTHIRLFSADSMHRFLRDHGFVIEHVAYPFFETRHFTKENLERLFDTSQISPPFYGNFMTFYVRKPKASKTHQSIMASRAVLEDVAEALSENIEQAAEMVASCLSGGGKVLVCGNGGSAADAQHFVAELVGRYLTEREPLAAIALTTDTSILTAVGNDYGYENVFTRQVQALSKAGDVLIGISTSGSSHNVLEAFKVAKKKNLQTIALFGKGKDGSVEAIDLALNVPSHATPRIQEAHGLILHEICRSVDERLRKTD